MKKTIDFIDINCKKEIIDENIEKLIKGDIEELTVSRIISDTFCEMYDIEADDFNG